MFYSPHTEGLGYIKKNGYLALEEMRIIITLWIKLKIFDLIKILYLYTCALNFNFKSKLITFWCFKILLHCFRNFKIIRKSDWLLVFRDRHFDVSLFANNLLTICFLAPCVTINDVTVKMDHNKSYLSFDVKSCLKKLTSFSRRQIRKYSNFGKIIRNKDKIAKFLARTRIFFLGGGHKTF